MVGTNKYEIPFFKRLERIQEESSLSSTSSYSYRDVVNGVSVERDNQSPDFSQASQVSPKRGLPARPSLFKFLGNLMGNRDICQWSSPKLVPKG